MQEDITSTAGFFRSAIAELGGFSRPAIVKVMDFGCGKGQLVRDLCQLGFDAYGCDVKAYWLDGQSSISERLSTISISPYQLPFENNSFDIIVSTSVLEHAQNKEECFREIHRLLRPGGWAMHLYPGKWYLPFEPHIYIPLVNYFWPRCSKWYLGLWAILGVRNEFQQDQNWRAVMDLNHHFCQTGLSYLTTREYQKLSLDTFGNCEWPMQFYINNANGGVARLLKGLPFKGLSGKLCREIRMAFLIQNKIA